MWAGGQLQLSAQLTVSGLPSTRPSLSTHTLPSSAYRRSLCPRPGLALFCSSVLLSQNTNAAVWEVVSKLSKFVDITRITLVRTDTTVARMGEGDGAAPRHNGLLLFTFLKNVPKFAFILLAAQPDYFSSIPGCVGLAAGTCSSAGGSCTLGGVLQDLN